MRKFKDMTGQKVGRLNVLNYHRKNGRVYWLCICDCGNFTEVRSDRLASGDTKSCGCLQKEMVSKMNTKHNMMHTRLYDIWIGMKQRCYNVNHKRYRDWGGRGVTVCDEWRNDFMNFYNWAINNGYNDNLTIDRIDNNKGYEPSNCRWVDRKTQQRNRRNTKYITYNGITKPLVEWCEYYHKDYNIVYNRIYNNDWSIERALELEVK